MQRTRIIAGVAVALAAMTVSAHASSIPAMDQLVQEFRTQATRWQAPLMGYAKDTFAILATIELAWSGIMLALKRAPLEEWFSEVVRQMLFIGFFLAALINTVTWGGLIIDSFRTAGAVGGGGISPTDIMAAGVTIAHKVISQMTVLHPVTSSGLFIAALVIIWIYAQIVAEMATALVSSYINISVGVFFMGFGGSRWTKDIAISTIRYIVAIGARLMVLQLLVGLGYRLIQNWIATFDAAQFIQIAVMIGCSVVLLELAKSIPQQVQGLVNGSHMVSGHGGAIAATAGVAAGVTAGAAMMVGAPAVAMQAARLAHAQVTAKEGQSSSGEPPSSGIAKAGKVAAKTMGNIGSSAMGEVGRRLTGGAARGSAPWRMASDMGGKRQPLDKSAASNRTAGKGQS